MKSKIDLDEQIFIELHDYELFILYSTNKYRNIEFYPDHPGRIVVRTSLRVVRILFYPLLTRETSVY